MHHCCKFGENAFKALEDIMLTMFRKHRCIDKKHNASGQTTLANIHGINKSHLRCGLTAASCDCDRPGNPADL